MARRVSKRRAASEWVQQVAAWRRSGESAEAFAGRRGLKASTLTWWAWRLRRDEAAAGEARPLTLVPVDVVVDDGDAGEVGVGHWEVVTAAGHRLRGDSRVEPELARALVAALSSAG